jgi:DNA-binding IclR family transcriptional regulator
MKVLNGSNGPLSPKEIALKAHMNRSAVRRLVQELYLKRKISRPKRGLYKAC